MCIIARLIDQDSLQKINRPAHSLHARKNDILMLDRQPAVIAVETQPIAKLTPPFFVVAISDGDVAPSDDLLTFSCPMVSKRPVRLSAGIIHQCVLRVHMMNGVTEGVDGGKGIGAHPEEVARVKIGADDSARPLSLSFSSVGTL